MNRLLLAAQALYRSTAVSAAARLVPEGLNQQLKATDPILSQGTQVSFFSKSAKRPAPSKRAGAQQKSKSYTSVWDQLPPVRSSNGKLIAPRVVKAKAMGILIGKEIRIPEVVSHYRNAVLHAARDFCVLATNPPLEPEPAGSPQIQEAYIYAQSRAQQPPPEPQQQYSRQEQQQEQMTMIMERANTLSQDVQKVMPLHQCLVVFQFGAVVFLEPWRNRIRFRENQLQNWIKQLHPHTVEPEDPVKRLTSEGLHITLQPELTGGLNLVSDDLVLKKWNQGNLDIVTRVIGQSVALDFHTSAVDAEAQRVEEMVSLIREEHRMSWIVRQLKMRGTHLRLNSFVVLLCDLNLFHSKLTRKLGILNKDHTSWESEEHEKLWQKLRTYFEIRGRWEQLVKQLDELRDRADFLLRLRSDQKSHRTEWIIIILISVEILLTLILSHHPSEALMGSARTLTGH